MYEYFAIDNRIMPEMAAYLGFERPSTHASPESSFSHTKSTCLALDIFYGLVLSMEALMRLNAMRGSYQRSTSARPLYGLLSPRYLFFGSVMNPILLNPPDCAAAITSTIFSY